MEHHPARLNTPTGRPSTHPDDRRFRTGSARTLSPLRALGSSSGTLRAGQHGVVREHGLRSHATGFETLRPELYVLRHDPGPTRGVTGTSARSCDTRLHLP
jgi:hypothetical protein